MTDNMILIFLTILIIILMICIPLIQFIYRRGKNLKTYFEIRWKKSSSLKPVDILGVRGEAKYGFHEYYFWRKEAECIKKEIENNNNVIIIGYPLTGKSRAIYQVLVTLNKPHDVIIPRLVDINPDAFSIPRHCKFWRKTILVLNDLDKFVERQNFVYLLKAFCKRKTIIIASCRKGVEYNILRNKLESDFHPAFGDPIELPKISKMIGHDIAKQTGKKLPATFDGNIGSIFLQLDTMKDRFRKCDNIQKAILRSIKRLYYAGIYREREIFSPTRIKRVCNKDGIDTSDYEWTELLDSLKTQGFVKTIRKEEIWAEETYLAFVIDGTLSTLGNLNEMMDIFSNDSEALWRIAGQSYYIGLMDVEKSKYLKVAIKAFQKCLEATPDEKFLTQHPSIQINLGTMYCALAEVENKDENCTKAVHFLKEALNVINMSDFPIMYALAYSNLGVACSRLAEVKNRAENCKQAVIAYKEALKVQTFEKFPIDYATIQNNLGAAYIALAVVENKLENCTKAIDALKEALNVKTLEKFPIDYATIQNNLGAAYRGIAVFDGKKETCMKAIDAIKEALRVRTLKALPLDYIATKMNLANTYRTLAGIEDKDRNCRIAIAIYKKLLDTLTNVQFPEMQRLVIYNYETTLDFCNSQNADS